MIWYLKNRKLNCNFWLPYFVYSVEIFNAIQAMRDTQATVCTGAQKKKREDGTTSTSFLGHSLCLDFRVLLLQRRRDCALWNALKGRDCVGRDVKQVVWEVTWQKFIWKKKTNVVWLSCKNEVKQKVSITSVLSVSNLSSLHRDDQL